MNAGPADALARWQNYGADPAYKTAEAAIKDAQSVFIRAGWPLPVAKLMAEKMASEDGEDYVLNVGDRVDFMRTGPNGLWRNVLVDFKNKPDKDMEFAAPAKRWILSYEGEVFEAILPRVCKNLSGRRRRVVTARKECAYVLFEAKADDAYAIVHVLGPEQDEGDCRISAAGPAPAGGMNFDRVHFKDLVEEVPNRCPTDWIPRVFGLPGLRVGSFPVSPGWFAVKVPIALADNPGNRVVVCLVRKTGESTHSMGVQSFDYRLHEPTGRKIATIWYSEPEIREDYRGATNLWWRWSGRRASCRGNGNFFY